MKRSLLLLLSILFAQIGVSQEYRGHAANTVVPGASFVKFKEGNKLPYFVKFRPGMHIEYRHFNEWFVRQFDMDANFGMILIGSEKDGLGHMHYRYQQTFKGHPIEGAIGIAHTNGGLMYSFNGDMLTGLDLPENAAMSVGQARNLAIAEVGAERYKWEMPEEEALLKRQYNDPSATYFPGGELVYIARHGKYKKENLRLAYKFNIYADKPLHKGDVYIDAITGEVLFETHDICSADAVGTANTGYSGTQTITSDSFGGGFRLRESGRGNGIETYNCNFGTNYGAATDFTDNDNFWNATNGDEYATDAHWGAEVTYDYFFLEHGRNSIDDAGFTLLSYVHYDNNYSNAFWDGSRMTYGSGAGNNSPFTALDITGHEIAHGLTNFTSNLVYQDESGALNESFSDIFGEAVEYYGKPLDFDWTVGEDIGGIRDMSNPGAYGDPDTYQAGNWYFGAADNGGVHTNSGVQNYWFYLLVDGETGTNDIGNSYTVNSIGWTKAGAIAFRNNTVYMTVNSQYADARFFSIQSAEDLYGPCSPEVIEVTNAWYAVGVGGPFDPNVNADFQADLTSNCSAPFTVNFTNLSNNGGVWDWDFGDGGTSTQMDPSYTYTAPGTYDVTLIADGGACGVDTTVRMSYIVIDPNYPCQAILPPSGSGTTQTGCIGTLFDDGGTSNNYGDNMDVQITISPTGATQVQLDFVSFGFETGYDYLYVYDGPNTGSPLIGQYDGFSLPNGGTITSTGPSITLRQVTDQFVNESGFEVNWSCTAPGSPPNANFSVDDQYTCSGQVQFTDISANNPTSWLWDFGDGNTSTAQNPSHVYLTNGAYDVTLTATNANGSTSVTYYTYVTVQYSPAPQVTDAISCVPAALTLYASGTGDLNWYDTIGGTLVNVGNSYTTPLLSQTETYYVQERTGTTTMNVGPVDNTFGGGGYFNGDQHLIFNVDVEITLESVWVDANGGGNRTIELRDNTGTVLQSLTVNIPDGQGRVNLNFVIPPGTGYQLGTANGSNPDLYRNNSGPSYPYEIPGLVSITSSSAGGDYYYFFYDWEIREEFCISEYSMVTAAIGEAPTSSDESRCGTGTLDMSATGTGIGNIQWFDAAVGGNVVGSGSPFTTPVLSSTTNYWVGEELTPAPQYVGALDNNIGGGGYFNGTQHLIFDVGAPCTLVSAIVYADNPGNRTIELRDNTGTVLQDTTINVPVGATRITLNFDLTVGTGFQLGTGANPDLYRNNSGPAYPYDLPGLVTITSSSAGNGFYYFFYDWEIQEASCITARTPVQAIINTQGDATISPAGPFCPADPALNLTAATGGGTWSGTGITDVNAGTFDPGVAGQGTHQIIYNIPGACGDADTLNIFINANFDATITPAGPFCSNGAPVNMTAVDGGGTWSGPGMSGGPSFDPVAAGAGTHTITYTIPGGCGDTDTETIVVAVAEDASINPPASTNLCLADAAFNLSGVNPNGLWSGTGITDVNAGTFDPAAAGVGTHTVMYTISGACGDMDSIVLTVNTNFDATITPVADMCSNEGIITLVATDGGGVWSGSGIVDANAGTFDPAMAILGANTITYTISGNCGDTDQTTINILQAPDATINNSGPFCQDDAPVNLTAGSAGGTWSGTGITDAVNGTFDPAVSGLGTFVVNYVINGTCSDSASANIIVMAMSDATPDPAGPFCLNHPAQFLTAAEPGGTWSGNGIINGSTGQFNPNTAGVGTHTITYSIPGNCGDTQTIDIVVDDCTGIGEDENAWSVNAYPVPATTNVSLSIAGLPAGSRVTVQIVNNIGQIIDEKAIVSNVEGIYNLDVTNLASGIYTIQVQGDKGRKHTQMIIQR